MRPAHKNQGTLRLAQPLDGVLCHAGQGRRQFDQGRRDIGNVGLARQDILWQGDYVAYPHFINEAAYYDSNVAMSMAIKHKVAVPKP